MNTYTTYIFDQEVTVHYTGAWIHDAAHGVPMYYEVADIRVLKDGEELVLSDELVGMACDAVRDYEDAERVYEGVA